MSAIQSALSAGVHAWRCEREMHRYQARLGAWAKRDPVIVDDWAVQSTVIVFPVYVIASLIIHHFLGGL